MSRGIIYVMSSVVPGLIKIGKTGSANYEQRMYNLEHNGYCNVSGMKRAFAIEVDDYDDKEVMLHTIFEKSRVADTELFALDINIALQLLSSFEGKVIYPQSETNEEVFERATSSETKVSTRKLKCNDTDKVQPKADAQGKKPVIVDEELKRLVGKSDVTAKSKTASDVKVSDASKSIPDGTYTLTRSSSSATVIIRGGSWTLKKGSIISTTTTSIPTTAQIIRDNLHLTKDGILLEDYIIGEASPSQVGCAVTGTSCNGWAEWRDKNGSPMSIYRNTASSK